MASSGSPSRSAFAGFVNAAAGAADLDEFEQAAAEAHAGTAVPGSLVGSIGSPANFDIGTLAAGQQIREPQATIATLHAQVAGFAAILKRMEQEGEAVKAKLQRLEESVAPGADPWQPDLTAMTAGPPGFSGSAMPHGVEVAPLKPPDCGAATSS